MVENGLSSNASEDSPWNNGLLRKYFSYNPNADPNGSYGKMLADAVIERYGSIENVPSLLKKRNVEGMSLQELKEKGMLEKKLTFLARIDGMQLNPEALFQNRAEKEDLLRKYKRYNKCSKMANNSNEDLMHEGDFYSRCSDCKIGLIFRDFYRSCKTSKKK